MRRNVRRDTRLLSTRVRRSLLVAGLFAGLTGVASSSAQTQEGEVDSSDQSAVAVQVDSAQAGVSDFVLRTVNRIDRFFAEDQYSVFEENRSRLRLRLNADLLETQDAEFTPSVQLHLVLPGLNNRLRVVANEDDEQRSRGEDPDDESNLALRWVVRQSRRLGVSYDLGMRIRGDDVAGFGRVNIGASYGLGETWVGRSRNQLYWYTDTGFRNDFRQYFERQLSERFFFRSRTRLQYFEEEGRKFFPEQRFTVFQRLTPRQAVAYETLAEVIPASKTPFDDADIARPDNEYTRLAFRLRWRANVWRPWLFVEAWPTLILPEERDYNTTWALRLRVEVNFGATSPGDTQLEE